VNPPEQRPSASAATAERRSARNRAARRRDGAVAQPLVVAISGAFGSACDCGRVSQVQDLTPIDFALLTRAVLAASCGASGPLSVAATVRLRIGDMIGDEALRGQAF
jgi:hypothetical protein